MVDISAPPLVGAYGPAGAGKSADAIWAVPNALFVANPGALIPAVSTVGYTPQFVELLDPKKGDLDAVKVQVERRLPSLKTADSVVIDDLSMIAQRTVRLWEAKYKDGRQLYGKFRQKASELFDEWRSYGLVVLVSAHDMPPEYKETEEGVRLGMETIGGPSIPGTKAGPEMVKAFDSFFRCVRSGSQGLGIPGLMGDPGPTEDRWPWRYTAGPWASDSSEWETKDRWNVPHHSNQGILPMNIGEILRFAHRRYGAKFKGTRAPGCEWIEGHVQWATEQILAGQDFQRMLQAVVQDAVTKWSVPMWQISWLTRDIRARVQLEKLHSREAQLAAMGVSGIVFTPPATGAATQ